MNLCYCSVLMLALEHVLPLQMSRDQFLCEISPKTQQMYAAPQQSLDDPVRGVVPAEMMPLRPDVMEKVLTARPAKDAD